MGGLSSASKDLVATGRLEKRCPEDNCWGHRRLRKNILVHQLVWLTGKLSLDKGVLPRPGCFWLIMNFVGRKL